MFVCEARLYIISECFFFILLKYFLVDVKQYCMRSKPVEVTVMTRSRGSWEGEGSWGRRGSWRRRDSWRRRGSMRGLP